MDLMSNHQGLRFITRMVLVILLDFMIGFALFSILRVVLRPAFFQWTLVFDGLSLLIVNLLVLFNPFLMNKLTVGVRAPIQVWTALYFALQLILTLAGYYKFSVKGYIFISLLLLLLYFGPVSAIYLTNEHTKQWGKS